MLQVSRTMIIKQIRSIETLKRIQQERLNTWQAKGRLMGIKEHTERKVISQSRNEYLRRAAAERLFIGRSIPNSLYFCFSSCVEILQQCTSPLTTLNKKAAKIWCVYCRHGYMCKALDTRINCISAFVLEINLWLIMRNRHLMVSLLDRWYSS